VIKLPGGEAYAVVGMVPHIRFQAYFPYSQSSRADKVLLLRSKGDPVALTMDLRKVIASIDPNVAIGRTNTYEDVIAQRLVTRKLSLLLVSLFSGAALLLSAIGVVIGIVSALLLGHLIENVLYGVSATDPISLGISVIILGLAAFVACLLPALRATRINPITALREWRRFCAHLDNDGSCEACFSSCPT
jgi:hypothetical protein